MLHDAMHAVGTPDGPMDVYEVVPEGKTTGAVIVIQEAFGVNEYIRDVTRRFAAAGYYAVAPTMFHRAGGGTAPYDDFSKVMPLFSGLTDDGIVMDVDAALGHLRQAGFDEPRIGIVGFSLFQPLIGDAGKLQTPWLGLFGDADASIPVADVERLRETLAREADVAHEIVRYPGAQHGFHCDLRPSYQEAAATDGWMRTLEWLRR